MFSLCIWCGLRSRMVQHYNQGWVIFYHIPALPSLVGELLPASISPAPLQCLSPRGLVIFLMTLQFQRDLLGALIRISSITDVSSALTAITETRFGTYFGLVIPSFFPVFPSWDWSVLSHPRVCGVLLWWLKPVRQLVMPTLFTDQCLSFSVKYLPLPISHWAFMSYCCSNTLPRAWWPESTSFY